MISVDSTSGGDGNKDTVNNEVNLLNQRNNELKKRILNNPSFLDPRVYELMKMVWDIDRMNRTLLELNIDTDKNPLGRLKAD